MFGERVRRGWRAGVAALLAALALALVWQAGVSPDVAFLWPAWQGAWIVHPYPAVKFQGSPTCPATVFALQFVPAAQPAHCRVRIAALGDFTATLNGRPLPKPQTQNWKRGTDYDLAADLRAGETNELRVVVDPQQAPPALLVAGPAAVRSDNRWTVAVAPQFVAGPVALAGTGEGYLRSDPVPGWKRLVLLGLVAFAAYASLPLRWKPWLKPGPAAPARGWWRRHGCVILLLLAVLVVLGHNVGLYRYQRSVFDWSGHVGYIQFVATHGQVPLPTQGWEFFQPPLYYFVAAEVWKGWGSFQAVQIFSALAGAVQVGLLGWLLAVVYPGRPRVRTLGFCLAAPLPMVLYMNPAITNEVFAATLVSVVLLVASKVGCAARLSVAGALLLGAVCGLAALAKYTGLLVFASVLVLLGLRSATETGFWRRAGLTAAVALAICSWLYWRNAVEFGNPCIGNWDTACGYHYEQIPGYRTLGFYTRFGSVFFRRVQQSVNSSFWDGMYGSLWADSHGTFLRLGDPHTQALASLSLWLAFLPTVGIAVGLVLAARQVVRDGWNQPLFVLLLTTVLTGVALILFTMKVPFFSTVKAFFALSLTGPLAVFGGLGLDVLTGRLGRLRFILYANLVALAGLSLYLYWYRGT